MPTNGNGRFQYPSSDWAQGRMRMARTGKLPDQPTLGEVESARGSMDYDTLTETVGKENARYIKKWDGIVGHPNAPTDQQKAWQLIRKRMIEDMQKNFGQEPAQEPEAGPRKNYPYSVTT
jgi:hypothetical protein